MTDSEPWSLAVGSGSNTSRSASLKMRRPSGVRSDELAPLLLDVAQLFAEEAEVAVLLHQRDELVLQQLVDRRLDLSAIASASALGCIRLATFCTLAGRLPRICRMATVLATSCFSASSGNAAAYFLDAPGGSTGMPAGCLCSRRRRA